MGYRKNSDFVYADLSSYDTSASRSFYSEVFGWNIYNMGKASSEPGDQFGMDQVNYYVATQHNEAAAGIYDMPPFFQQINMPPFWMSYLAIDDIQSVVARAKATPGATVDVEPTPFGDGTMALIRDPLGAGFTCYEGPSIDSKCDGSVYGRMVWNELITASIAKVEHFYHEVVGLQVIADEESQGTRAKLLNQQGTEIAGIQQADTDIRGEKVYWVPFFSVDSINDFSARVTAAGGEMLAAEQGSAICYDNSGAAFGVTETGASFSSAQPWYRRLF